MDDLYDGWTGLNPELFQRLETTVLNPLREQSSARYQIYDWSQERFGGWTETGPERHVILEGVGAGDAVTRPWATVKVWIDVTAATGMTRGLRRDISRAAQVPNSQGDPLDALGSLPLNPANLADSWHAWQRLQEQYFASGHNRTAADLRFSTD
jgi:hypothetical protein